MREVIQWRCMDVRSGRKVKGQCKKQPSMGTVSRRETQRVFAAMWSLRAPRSDMLLSVSPHLLAKGILVDGNYLRVCEHFQGDGAEVHDLAVQRTVPNRPPVSVDTAVQRPADIYHIGVKRQKAIEHAMSTTTEMLKKQHISEAAR